MEEVDALEMRRLDPERDEYLIQEALSWTGDQPLFFRNAEKAWADRPLNERADFGIFENEELIAVITITLEGQGSFDSHLMAKRGTDPQLIAMCVGSVIKQLFQQGMREGWAWPAEKNRGLKRILEATGMKRDGLEIFKGSSHGRPLLWQRYSVRSV